MLRRRGRGARRGLAAGGRSLIATSRRRVERRSAGRERDSGIGNNPLKRRDSRKTIYLDFVPENLDFVPSGLDFVPASLGFVPTGLEIVPCGQEVRPRPGLSAPAGWSVEREGTVFGFWRLSL